MEMVVYRGIVCEVRCIRSVVCYLWQAKCWKWCVTRSVELTEIYRQSNKQFIALLQNIRIGRYGHLIITTDEERIFYNYYCHPGVHRL